MHFDALICRHPHNQYGLHTRGANTRLQGPLGNLITLCVTAICSACHALAAASCAETCLWWFGNRFLTQGGGSKQQKAPGEHCGAPEALLKRLLPPLPQGCSITRKNWPNSSTLNLTALVTRMESSGHGTSTNR